MAKAKKQTDGAKIPKTLKRLAKAKVQGELVPSGQAPDKGAKPIIGGKTLAEVFLEAPIGPPHPAFPTSLLPEGAGFESLGAPSEFIPKQREDNPTKPQQTEPSVKTPSTSKAPIPLDRNSQEPNSTETDGSEGERGNQDGNQSTLKDGTQAENQMEETTQTDHIVDTGKMGDEIPSVAETAAVYGENQPILAAFSREGETRSQCWERLRKEARLAGLPRGQGPGTAYEWATREADRLFPPKVKPAPEPVAAEPIEPEQVVEEATAPIVQEPPPAAPADLGVAGLGDMPPDWPQLPANASLQVEIAWVSANRLRVRSGSGVDLSRALSPAPSYSALSWLETSILFPSKFADISVKATAQQDDEKEHIRREKLAIEEVRSILAEMLE